MSTGRHVSLGPLSPGQCAQAACLLEATARKPGNVHPQAAFHDTSYTDFLLSALAIGPVMDRAPELPLGEVVLEAVRQTRRVVGRNTNLGTVLLLAPMAAVPAATPLRDGLAHLLGHLTLDDARSVYQAIRLASPGGLGSAPDQDVAAEPTRPLLECMRLAADRDLIARQYVSQFREVFDEGVPALEGALQRGWDWEQATIRCHLELLGGHRDSLIERKCGASVAEQARRRAAAVLAAGWPHGRRAQRLLRSLDRWLRADANRRNPGTTADLVAAAWFVLLRARSGSALVPDDERGAGRFFS